MTFYELEPLSVDTCQHCALWVLDIGADGCARRHVCRIHGDVDLDVDFRLFRRNDCPDLLHLANDAVTSTFSRRNK